MLKSRLRIMNRQLKKLAKEHGTVLLILEGELVFKLITTDKELFEKLYNENYLLNFNVANQKKISYYETDLLLEHLTEIDTLTRGRIINSLNAKRIVKTEQYFII